MKIYYDNVTRSDGKHRNQKLDFLNNLVEGIMEPGN
jgi:hypothetical protein